MMELLENGANFTGATTRLLFVVRTEEKRTKKRPMKKKTNNDN